MDKSTRIGFIQFFLFGSEHFALAFGICLMKYTNEFRKIRCSVCLFGERLLSNAPTAKCGLSNVLMYFAVLALTMRISYTDDTQKSDE